MNFQAAFLFSLLLFFTVGIESTISQSMELPAEPTFLGHSTITVTTTPASPKITYTKTTTVTTYGLPSHFTYQVTSTPNTSPIIPFPSPNQQNHYIQSHSGTGKLIALLFAAAAILTVFVTILALIGRKRYHKQQQKRIEDWVELSTEHGGWERGSKDLAGLEGGIGEGVGIPQAAVLRGL